MSGVFVTGSDTGCGKTEVSLGLMAALRGRGIEVVGMKPVASGCERTPNGLRNDDALRLRAQASRTLPYEQINPYAFEPPIAPHVAAAKAGVEIRIEHLRSSYRKLASVADFVVVEGVGGWAVPISDERDVADLALALDLPVVLVIGLRLGCINHGLLTAQAILERGAAFAGWIGNQIDPRMPALTDNIEALARRIPVPCLGVVPWAEKPDPWITAKVLRTESLVAGAEVRGSRFKNGARS